MDNSYQHNNTAAQQHNNPLGNKVSLLLLQEQFLPELVDHTDAFRYELTNTQDATVHTQKNKGSLPHTDATRCYMPEPKRKSSAMWGSSSNKKASRQNSSSSRSKNINVGDAEKLWNEIVDEGTVASMEGISVLCDKLDLDPLEDIRVLVLLWKMGATSKPAQISRDEWMKGCEKLQVDTVAKFKELLPSLEVGFLDNDEFKEFYKVRLRQLVLLHTLHPKPHPPSFLQFCFQFNREGTHKTVDKELVIMLLQLVLKDSNRVSVTRLDSFCRFLESSTDYRRITLDQWTSFWDFSQECDDLSGYDENTSAWPVMIDEYVEFMQAEK